MTLNKILLKAKEIKNQLPILRETTFWHIHIWELSLCFCSFILIVWLFSFNWTWVVNFPKAPRGKWSWGPKATSTSREVSNNDNKREGENNHITKVSFFQSAIESIEHCKFKYQSKALILAVQDFPWNTTKLALKHCISEEVQQIVRSHSLQKSRFSCTEYKMPGFAPFPEYKTTEANTKKPHNHVCYVI